MTKILLFILMAAFYMAASYLDKNPSGETRCVSNPYFLLTSYSSIQFLIRPLSQHSQLDYLWLLATYCAALV